MRVSCEERMVRYRSRRNWPHSRASSELLIEPGQSVTPEELTEHDHFLTARYCLYTLLRDGLARAQIEHPPWPLVRAKVLAIKQNLIEAAGLPSPNGSPLAHYAAELDVKIGYPRLCTA